MRLKSPTGSYDLKLEILSSIETRSVKPLPGIEYTPLWHVINQVASSLYDE